MYTLFPLMIENMGMVPAMAATEKATVTDRFWVGSSIKGRMGIANGPVA
ncbi:hypothetical protein [Neorhizobium sp. LjRoot104]